MLTERSPKKKVQVEHIVCDRLRERERFRAAISEAVSNGCSAVVDFCAFHKASVLDVVLGIGSVSDKSEWE